jgi:tetratricopeptide (TPR) repeat protein
MTRLAEREKTERPLGARFTVACYFARAVEFAPDDGAVRVLYGIYLSRRGHKNEALEHLQAAQKLLADADNPNLHYNLGLAYFELKDYDKALAHAKKAYELGFPLPGLRDKLKRAGKWHD